jgi:hypothetical protein
MQKNQRDSAFGHHMQKYIFLGYPEGYKGWRFYNPTTKKVIITERADFDERYTCMPLKPAPTPPPVANDVIALVALCGRNRIRAEL